MHYFILNATSVKRVSFSLLKIFPVLKILDALFMYKKQLTKSVNYLWESKQRQKKQR